MLVTSNSNHCNSRNNKGSPIFVPRSGHVDSDLLQQTLPVTDIKIGSSGPNFGLDVQVQRLQLAVRLSFEHYLDIDAHSRVDALTTIT